MLQVHILSLSFQADEHVGNYHEDESRTTQYCRFPSKCYCESFVAPKFQCLMVSISTSWCREESLDIVLRQGEWKQPKQDMYCLLFVFKLVSQTRWVGTRNISFPHSARNVVQEPIQSRVNSDFLSRKNTTIRTPLRVSLNIEFLY